MRALIHTFALTFTALYVSSKLKACEVLRSYMAFPIFIADSAAGPSLNSNILDHFPCNPSDDRDPSSVRQELLSTVQAQYWRLRYQAALDDVATIRERREEYYSMYTIALEEILKISMESGV